MAQHVFQMVHSFNVGGQMAQSVWHWRFEIGGFTSSVLAAAALASSWVNARFAQLAQLLPADVTILSTKCKAVDMPGGFEAFHAWPPASVGGRGVGMVASGLAPVVIFSCEHAAHCHGRWFIPGIAEGDCLDGFFTDAYKTLVATNIDVLFDDLVLVGGGAPTAVFVLWDRKNKIYEVPVHYQLSDTLGQIRRRQTPV